jgi:hypothetical protein
MKFEVDFLMKNKKHKKRCVNVSRKQAMEMRAPPCVVAVVKAKIMLAFVGEADDIKKVFHIRTIRGDKK